jgi:hypothetical protein
MRHMDSQQIAKARYGLLVAPLLALIVSVASWSWTAQSVPDPRVGSPESESHSEPERGQGPRGAVHTDEESQSIGARPSWENPQEHLVADVGSALLGTAQPAEGVVRTDDEPAEGRTGRRPKSFKVAHAQPQSLDRDREGRHVSFGGEEHPQWQVGVAPGVATGDSFAAGAHRVRVTAATLSEEDGAQEIEVSVSDEVDRLTMGPEPSTGRIVEAVADNRSSSVGFSHEEALFRMRWGWAAHDAARRAMRDQAARVSSELLNGR